VFGLAISSAFAAAYKMNDFQTVTGPEDGVWPFIARNDFEIQLHGNAVGLAAQLRDESRESNAIRKVSGFAVDLESHEHSLTSNHKGD